MAELAITEILTPELLEKLGVAGSCLSINAEMIELTAPRLVRILRENGIGVVDLDRHRCTIDERVYESALHRGRVGRAYLTPRRPSAKTWRDLKRSPQD